MLPILLGASVGQTGKARPAMIALGFVMSFSMVALLLSAITRVFDFDPNHLRNAAAIVLIGFGLLMIWPAPFERLSIRIGAFTGHSTTSRQGLTGGFVLGTTLGLVWTPCAGPVLGSILTVIATSKDTAWASLLLVAYAIGAALPMLAIAYGGQAVTTPRSQRRADRAAAAAGVRRQSSIAFAPALILPVRHADRWRG
jgi:cytochrome c biogenesis protein CcdA